MDMHGSLDRCGAARTKAAEGPSGKCQARMPDLCPGVFSAHDHAEGEFFSAPNENADNPGSLRRPGKEDGSLKGTARRGEARHPRPRSRHPQSEAARNQLPKIDDGDECHQRERHGARGARPRPELQAPATHSPDDHERQEAEPLTAPFITGTFCQPGSGGCRNPENLNDGQRAKQRADGECKKKHACTLVDQPPALQSQFPLQARLRIA